eukprot:c25944_g1_i1.p1 GENE.c25944_g1_i1~~c25944_g1_i1.p1  ORF type:complete len:394 (-),score=73.15 c25944_g1_i1:84-1265(-)
MGSGQSSTAADFADTSLDTSITEAEIESNYHVETYQNYWCCSSRTKLTEVEAQFFQQQLPNQKFTQKIVGGLGTIEIGTEPENANKPALVLVHGYGACNVFWSLSLELLIPRFRIYLVELHGHGRSDRIPFPKDLDAHAAETYMAEYIEKWRINSGLGEEKFFLVGHSLGAMICWRYGAIYPHRLHQLILLSPVGVKQQPPNLDERFSQAPFIFRWIISQWKKGTSPMDIIRGLGPFGKRLMRKLLERRINMYPQKSAARSANIDLLCEVMFQSWSLPESGERAMNAMLIPGAYAKSPLLVRLEQNMQPPDVPPSTLPLSLIYGSPNHDWMQPEYGDKLCRHMKETRGAVYASSRQVSEAGHMVAMDNPLEFQLTLIEEIEAATAAAALATTN